MDATDGQDEEESDSETEAEEEKPLESIPAPVLLPEPAPVLPPEPVVEAPAPEPMPTPVVPTIEIPPVLPTQPTPVEETLPPTPSTPTINLDEKPNVQFSEFDAVFDSEDPERSDLVYYPKEDEDHVPDLEILDEVGTPLAEGDDFDSLEKKEDIQEGIDSLDYEELN